MQRLGFGVQSWDNELRSRPPRDDICSTAQRLETETLIRSQLSLGTLTLWSNILDDVFLDLQPSNSDISIRGRLVQKVDDLVKSVLPGSFVTPFGSYSMNLSTPSSDLDLSLNLYAHHQGPSRVYKVSILKMLRRVLERHSSGFSRVTAVIRATVPVIKFTDRYSGIECDLSVGNNDGILKSNFLGLVCLVDPRFRKLCYLVKAWAKAQNINDSKTGTLNSFSWILLVALHLQTRSPPILPPFSQLLEGLPAISSNLDEVRYRVGELRKQSYGQNNPEGIPQLFGSFFIKLVSVENLWTQGLCASTYNGKWIYKAWKDNQIADISVEDFIDRSNNAARSVHKKEIDRIYNALSKCISLLNFPMHKAGELDSRGVSLFGDSYRHGKRPPQQLLPGPYEKQPKLADAISIRNSLSDGQSSNFQRRLLWPHDQLPPPQTWQRHGRDGHGEGQPNASTWGIDSGAFPGGPYYEASPQNGQYPSHPVSSGYRRR